MDGYNIQVFSCVVQIRVISCAQGDVASHYEISPTFYSGDDRLASLTLDDVRSSPEVTPI